MFSWFKKVPSLFSGFASYLTGGWIFPVALFLSGGLLIGGAVAYIYHSGMLAERGKQAHLVKERVQRDLKLKEKVQNEIRTKRIADPDGDWLSDYYRD